MKEKREKKERVLIFSSREICYCSGNFFAHQLAAAFEELGFAADICELSPDDDLDAVLMPFLWRKLPDCRRFQFHASAYGAGGGRPLSGTAKCTVF